MRKVKHKWHISTKNRRSFENWNGLKVLQIKYSDYGNNYYEQNKLFAHSNTKLFSNEQAYSTAKCFLQIQKKKKITHESQLHEQLPHPERIKCAQMSAFYPVCAVVTSEQPHEKSHTPVASLYI